MKNRSTSPEIEQAEDLPVLEFRRREDVTPPASLAALSSKFESLLERMQTPAARKAMEAVFNATSEELGRAAAEGALGLASETPAQPERRHPVDQVWATHRLGHPVDDALDEMRGPRPG